MLDWYTTVFGAKVQHQSPALAFLTFDDEHHRFAFANLAVLQPDGTELERRGAIGVDHVGYTFASLRDLLETYSRLEQEGISPYWCIHHGITVSLYYADPDGNQMEFQVDCCESSEEATEFMHATWDDNPIGVEFDPEEWLAQLRAGTPESDLLTRRDHAPVSPIRGEIANLLSAD